MNPDLYGDILKKGLEIAAGFPGLPGMIFTMVIIVCICILIIAKYFFDKNQREKDAEANRMKTDKERLDLSARMSADMSKAFRDAPDVMYAQDYDVITKSIALKKYETVYGKYNTKFADAISKVIYDETLTPEDRAARVILIVKPQ